MRLQLILPTVAFPSCVASRVLNLGASITNNSQIGPPRYRLTESPVTPPHERLQHHAGRSIKFKRDGSVTGFFDDDYASDADWKKYIEKGGALVR